MIGSIGLKGFRAPGLRFQYPLNPKPHFPKTAWVLEELEQRGTEGAAVGAGKRQERLLQSNSLILHPTWDS